MRTACRSLCHKIFHKADIKSFEAFSLSLQNFSIGKNLGLPPCTSSGRRLSTDTQSPLHFCVVGSGPAGFYTVSQLLKTFNDRARVALLERLPTPFGLVRSGVAPDHPDTKNVINQFTELGKDPRVRFFGNVNVGQDLPLSTLRALFHGVILAYGAESNRVLDIPGRHLEGIFTAREFVWWYNGHPEYTSLPVDLQQTMNVAVLGLGNVALDCARILLQPADRLQPTDIVDHAWSQLRQSNVQQVTLIGRRGPAQAAFTAKELREILNMDGLEVVINPEDMVLTQHDQIELKKSRARKRVYDLLMQASQNQPQRSDSSRQLHLRFFRSPVRAVPKDRGQLSAIELDKTTLVQEEGRQIAVSSGETELLQAEIMLESIGYRSLAMPGAPFDESRGCIPNRQGRVVSTASADADALPGLYVSGWVKRGPSGIIGTNLVDATETVNKIAEDEHNAALPSPEAADSFDSLQMEIQKKGIQVVTFEDWSSKLDKYEVEQGMMQKKSRSKVVDIPQMLEICRSTSVER